MSKSSPARKNRKKAQKLQGNPQAAIRNLQVQLMMSEQRLRQEIQATGELNQQMAVSRAQFLIWMSVLIDRIGGKSVIITDKQYEKAQKIWAGMDSKRLKAGLKLTLIALTEIEDAGLAEASEGVVDEEA